MYGLSSPKEFKEEVKDIFTEYSNTITKFSAVRSELMNIFGLYNLTSNMDGEEMLTVKRSDVINEFDKLHKLSYKAADLQLGLNAFRTLFGSKCLPDENSSVVEEVSQQIGDKAVKYLEDYFEKQIDETKPAKSKTFSKEHRLNIAAMAMQSLLSNPYGFIIDGKEQDKTPENIAEAAFLCADALIAKSML